MAEARQAAMILGVPPERQFFLGYPDRGVFALLTDNFVTPAHSPFTDAASVPYPAGRLSRPSVHRSEPGT